MSKIVFFAIKQACFRYLEVNIVNIYVGNLAYAMADEDLRAAFEPFGQVDTASVIKDKMTGRSRGYGFVTMNDDTQAKAAIEGLNGKEVQGRKIVVSESRPKEDRGDRGPRRFDGNRRNNFGERRSPNAF